LGPRVGRARRLNVAFRAGASAPRARCRVDRGARVDHRPFRIANGVLGPAPVDHPVRRGLIVARALAHRDLGFGGRQPGAHFFVLQADQELAGENLVGRLDQHLADGGDDGCRNLDLARPRLDPSGRDRLPSLGVVARALALLRENHRRKCHAQQRASEEKNRSLVHLHDLAVHR
jgi:hypothetical protein